MLADAFDVFHLFEPIQRCVLLHEAGGVEQGARGRDFLSARDDVRLCALFRHEHRVHDVADLAGQDDVLDGGFLDVEIERFALLFHRFQKVCGKFALAGEQIVQSFLFHEFAERELERGMELRFVIVRFRDRLHDVGDAVGAGAADAKRHLIRGEQFLSDDFLAQEAGIHKFRLYGDKPVDKSVNARFEHAVELFADEQQRFLFLRYGNGADVGLERAGGKQIFGEVLGKFGAGEVKPKEGMRVIALPEIMFSRGQDVEEVSVRKMQREFSVVGDDFRRLRAERGVFQKKARIEKAGARFVRIADDDLARAYRSKVNAGGAERRVGARVQHADEFSVFEEESLKSFVDDGFHIILLIS